MGGIIQNSNALDFKTSEYQTLYISSGVPSLSGDGSIDNPFKNADQCSNYILDKGLEDKQDWLIYFFPGTYYINLGDFNKGIPIQAAQGATIYLGLYDQYFLNATNFPVTIDGGEWILQDFNKVFISRGADQLFYPINVKNAIIKSRNNTPYSFIRADLGSTQNNVFTNCVFDSDGTTAGTQFNIAQGASPNSWKFENCAFIQSSPLTDVYFGEAYLNAIFDSCTFNVNQPLFSLVQPYSYGSDVKFAISNCQGINWNNPLFKVTDSNLNAVYIINTILNGYYANIAAGKNFTHYATNYVTSQAAIKSGAGNMVNKLAAVNSVVSY